jgi:hypothetical protein
MKIEFIKDDNDKKIGYKLIPENESEKYQINEIRNQYFWGSVKYNGRENGCSKFAGNLKFKFGELQL